MLEEEEEKEEGGEEEEEEEEDDLFPNPLNPFDVDFEEERRLADSVVVEYVVVYRDVNGGIDLYVYVDDVND